MSLNLLMILKKDLEILTNINNISYQVCEKNIRWGIRFISKKFKEYKHKSNLILYTKNAH